MGIKSRICKTLSRCLKASLDEEEEDFRDDVDELREAAKEFNYWLDRVSRKYPTSKGWVWYTKYSGWISDGIHNFRIGTIEVSLDRSVALDE